MEIGKFGGHCLADDDRAGRAQARNRRGVAHRLAAPEQRRAAFGLEVGGVEDVLDADRNAVQRADRLAVAAALVERARLRQRIVWIEMNEGAYPAVDRRDPLQTGADIGLGADLAAGDTLGGFNRSERQSDRRRRAISWRIAWWGSQSAMPGKT